MKDSLYAIISTVVLGIGNMFLWTGYGSQGFIVESVLHSVHARSPSTVGAHDGYYGLAVMNFFYMTANLFVPSLNQAMRSKWILVIGGGLFAVYFATFQYLHQFIYFPACALLGVGFAAFNAGYSGYLSETSTRETLSKNQALSWSITTIAIFCAGLLYMFVTSMNDTGISAKYREYSDIETRYFFAAFAICEIMCMVTYSFLPNRDVQDSIASTSVRSNLFTEQMKTMLTVLVHKRTLLVVPFYLYVGVFFSYWINIFPTTIQFTRSLAAFIYLPAYFGMAFACGSFLMGMCTIYAAKRVKDFGLMPLMSINASLHLVIFALVLSSIPGRSAIEPNDDPSWIIDPNVPFVLIAAFLFGAGDAANNTVRTVVSSLILPQQKQQTFAASRFYHAMAATILFFASSHLTTHFYIAILAVILVVSLFCFWIVCDIIHYEDDAKRHPNVVFTLDKTGLSGRHDIIMSN